MLDHKIDILDRSLEELKTDMISIGEKPYRGEQIIHWLSKGVYSFSEMTNIPEVLIEKLEEHYTISTLHQLKRLTSNDKLTMKYLFLLHDNNIIECVVMKYYHGNTICLSTQVGCAMGCSFCASATKGLARNLTAGEMMAQVLAVNRDIANLGWGDPPSIGCVVLMGSGEPLDNYDNTLRFLHQIHEPKGFNLGYRNITLSTCGLIPKILALAEEDLSINLAVSLHAADDETRKKIMKIANVYSINDIMKASRFYFNKTGRRITFEYALIEGINDSPYQAHELAALLKGFPCHVNLIPLNENSHSNQKRSNEKTIKVFTSILKSAGINVTRRREMGQDIQGACGQLKINYLK
ncbi:MAG TPA: 23S rRNA (adenine(2503)-C(2))-methyltransferase RlmN [Clostridiales bacterium]|nr:23S rRNA (adenine(2503)-C(2))-methyltransferase RlmN [Clostridia bacterium]HCS72504.1 23S rRNA (adenine(2503)-C(2))-methyltransferase RlmN [Clostridiales bacterium]